MYIRLLLTFFLLNFCLAATTQPIGLQSFDAQLMALPDVVEVERLEPTAPFRSAYKIMLRQPLDHKNPDGETFTQRIYLSHKAFGKPMIMVTEGYAAEENYTSELAKILNANQLVVEHRYFGESVPDSLKWIYLTTEQAANDYHRIIELFNKMYSGKWLSTGISKGGQAALYHRYYYPDDVDISVPYVTPLNFEVEDPRIYKFVNYVGCRKDIFDFQKRLLEKRDEILPYMKWYCFGRGQTFAIGRETAYEYAVLEYPISFWQWGHECSKIPDKDASTEEMLEYLIEVVGFGLYSDKGVKYFEPLFYQAMTELGYYGFQTNGLHHLLKYATEPTNTIFAPVPQLKFDGSLSKKVYAWIRESGDRILYVYGELDTWSATAVNPSRKTDALKIMMKGRAHHDARIQNMERQDKEKVLEALNRWLNE